MINFSSHCKFIFLIIFCLSSSIVRGNLEREWSHFLSNENNRCILELALETRIGEEGQLSEKDKRLRALELKLKDYTSDSPHTTICELLEQELHYYPSQFIIKELERNADNNGDLIYFIYNLSNELISVVKGFHQKAGLAQELSALEKLYRLNLDRSQTVAPLAVGRALIQNKRVYLLVESPASGKALKDWATTLQSLEGKEREQSFLHLKSGLETFAKALAELHMKAAETKSMTVQPCDFLLRFTPTNDFCRKMLEQEGISIPLEEIDRFCEDLEKYIIFNFPSSIYVFRDLNWGNVFYDEKSEQITLIDTHTLHWCLNPQGEPTHHHFFAFLDFRMAFYMLSYFDSVFLKEEISHLAEHYTVHYRKAISQQENEFTPYFWKVLHLLTCIDSSTEHLYSSGFTGLDTRRLPQQSLENLKDYLDQLHQLKHDFYSTLSTSHRME